MNDPISVSEALEAGLTIVSPHGGVSWWREDHEPVGEVIRLSPRQSQVRVLIENSFPRPKIAEVLGISLRTVDAHTAVLFRKLHVHSCDELRMLRLGKRAYASIMNDIKQMSPKPRRH
jgi:DNA-binding NarL/FixJ family response regulator